ncbi:MAG: HDIG domain-containing protein [Bacteroidota bacterium]|nr:HDIG domain-containing protein [Bacteroidota bacterium]MDO9613468.1 HDIG domain-containing protein [Bacteroidota bacterium]
MISRENAIEFLNQHIQSANMIKHCLASEAVLRAIALKLNKNTEEWGMAGLLHDIDVEITGGDPLRHGLHSAVMLDGMLSAEAINAIVMHNEMASGKVRTTVFQHALAAGETITGLIMATALVYPDKKLASVKTKSITKRMKEKAFAASVNRETILECELIGIPIHDFAELSLAAMQEISDELGF